MIVRRISTGWNTVILRKPCVLYVILLFMALTYYTGLQIQLYGLQENRPTYLESVSYYPHESNHSRIASFTRNSLNLVYQDDGLLTEGYSKVDQTSLKFNCSGLHELHRERQLFRRGHLETYQGRYRDTDVTIKYVKPPKQVRVDITSATDAEITIGNHDLDGSHTETSNLLMRDVLMNQQLRSRYILGLLGFCYRYHYSGNNPDELLRAEMIAVLEGGTPFLPRDVINWPWKDKLNLAVQFLVFLDYLEHSPVGPLLLPRGTRNLFFLHHNKIKLADLSHISAGEVSCTITELTINNKTRLTRSCPYGILCTAGKCPGFIPVNNIFIVKAGFLQRLLRPKDRDVHRKLRDLWLEIENNPLRYTAVDIIRKLEEYR